MRGIRGHRPQPQNIPLAINLQLGNSRTAAQSHAERQRHPLQPRLADQRGMSCDDCRAAHFPVPRREAFLCFCLSTRAFSPFVSFVHFVVSLLPRSLSVFVGILRALTLTACQRFTLTARRGILFRRWPGSDRIAACCLAYPFWL